MKKRKGPATCLSVLKGKSPLTPHAVAAKVAHQKLGHWEMGETSVSHPPCWSCCSHNLPKNWDLLVDDFEKKFNSLQVLAPEDKYTVQVDAEEKEE
ncbi:ATP synthase subunit d, mitochondrial [Tupaia chinensis]|uniref:ATP synthase subunit d, mitochondrial n=1 Tax=Tupaia chinensis TaxID=246437 RepID=L9JDC6_TUPCH|nr:ATP synthase subunit d, mitochondrial [Tupaia chinensis]